MVMPWHDCPRCPHCKLRGGTPRQAVDFRHEAEPGDRLVCFYCGYGWPGTEEEVAQAERAQAAWEAKERREVQAARGEKR